MHPEDRTLAMYPFVYFWQNVSIQNTEFIKIGFLLHRSVLVCFQDVSQRGQLDSSVRRRLEDYFVPYLICVKIVWTLSLVLSPSQPFRQRYNVGGELPLVKETSDIMVSESESGLIRMMKTRQTSPTKHAISHVMSRAGRAPPPTHQMTYNVICWRRQDW